MKSALAATVLVLLASAVARADGVCTPRPPTAAEVASYKAGLAAFLASAPAAPEGWVQRDEPTDAEPGAQCVESGPGPRRSWSFMRSFDIEPATRQQREQEAVVKIQALMAERAQLAEANRPRLDAIGVELNALVARQIELATAQKFDEVGAVNEAMDALMKEQTALMGLAQADADMQAISALAEHDTSATYGLQTDASGSERESFVPFDAPVGQGYRQSYESGGNALEDVVLVFGSPAAGSATVPVLVRLHGDPGRVAALLAAAKLAPVAALAQ
jgi:hypothetical protein